MRKILKSFKQMYKKLKYLDKTKSKFFAILTIISLSCLAIGGSYAYFAITEHLNSYTITIANLKYQLTSEDTKFNNNTYTIEANTTKELTLKLKSLNDYSTKYALNYECDNSNVTVYYDGEQIQNVYGEISGLNSELEIKLIVDNTDSDKDATINFDLKGGYLQNELDTNITSQYDDFNIKASCEALTYTNYTPQMDIHCSITGEGYTNKDKSFSTMISIDGGETFTTYDYSDTRCSAKSDGTYSCWNDFSLSGIEKKKYNVIIKTSDSKGIVREVYNQTLGHNCITRKVQIVWDDAGYENQRPEEVVIMPIENGSMVTHIFISAEENWSIEFNYISEETDWDVDATVNEITTCGYYETKNKELKGDTFVITLTYIVDGVAGGCVAGGGAAGDGDDVAPPAP